MPRPDRPDSPNAAAPQSAQAQAPARRSRRRPSEHPHARGRYAAMTDRRHGKQSNLAFLIGGGFAVIVILVVIITATRMTTSVERDRAEAAERDNRAAELARETAAKDAARLAAARAEAEDKAAETTDGPDPDDTPPAPTTPPPVTAPDVSVVQVDYNPLTFGPWWVKPIQVTLDDTFECPRETINKALDQTLTLKAGEGRKLLVMYLSVEPKTEYTANQRAALSALPLIAEGQRKLADDEWVLVSDHFAMATVDPSTGARRAAKPMLLYAEDAEAGFAIAGSGDKSSLDFAVFASDPTELVLVFEVNPADKTPLLVVRAVPGLTPTPAFRLNLTEFGTMGSAGHTELVRLDPSLAPGEKPTKKTDDDDIPVNPESPSPGS